MAYLDRNYRDGIYKIVVERNGEKETFSTRTPNRDIANMVLARINVLEVAYSNGLSLEDVGLSEWASRLFEQNPKCYFKLAKFSLVPQVAGRTACELDRKEIAQTGDRVKLEICTNAHLIKAVPSVQKKSSRLSRKERAADHIIREVDGVLEVDFHYSFCYIENRDVIIYSRAKQNDIVYVYLTKETARVHGVGVGWQSQVAPYTLITHEKQRKLAGFSIFGENHLRAWVEMHEMLRCFSDLQQRIDIERRWEMYEAVVNEHDIIIPGKPLVRHVRTTNAKEN